MANLRDLVRAVQQDLPITVRHEKWLIDNSDPVFSESAISFAAKVLSGKVGGKRSRKPGFRASGMGKCARARVFARIGTVGVSEQFSSTQSNTFFTGNVMHLKWQLAGLTEGWMIQAEVPLHNDKHDLGGTADGLIYDGSLFEFKSINKRGYAWVNMNGPNEDHKRQVAAYKLLKPELTAASIIYENKESGEWREYRHYFTEENMEPVQKELAMLTRSMQDHELPPIKDECLTKSGMTYRRCPFRDICLKTRIWPKSVEE